jgi:hypothetical protein
MKLPWSWIALAVILVPCFSGQATSDLLGLQRLRSRGKQSARYFFRRYRALRFIRRVAYSRSHRCGDHADRRLQSLDSFALHAGTGRANGQ